MSQSSRVLLIDGGELSSARTTLDSIGVAWERASETLERLPAARPTSLLITTGALAVSLRCHKSQSDEESGATWIAFVSNASKTQRRALQQAGFDFLVNEPVHPVALRCLFQHALYAGGEQRRTPRLAFGYEVRFRSRFWRHRAMLADLSPRGARFLTTRPPAEGSTVRLLLPAEVARGRPLELPGRVVRTGSGPEEGGRPEESAVGIRFDALRAEPRARLRRILTERLAGPAELQQPVPASNAASPGDQRRQGRAHFDGAVMAITAHDSAVLVGHDLSAGGMRVEPDKHLSVGDEVRLAFAGQDREEPFLVEARVARDDGERGLGLRFDWVEPEAQARLENLIEALPVIDALADETPTRGRIFAQLLPSRLRRATRA